MERLRTDRPERIGGPLRWLRAPALVAAGAAAVACAAPRAPAVSAGPEAPPVERAPNAVSPVGGGLGEDERVRHPVEPPLDADDPSLHAS